MTNNKAIGILEIVVEIAKGRCFVTDEAISDAYAMAISALQEQEAKAQLSAEGTTFDLISRQAAIEAMSESLKRVFPEHRQIAEKCLKALPSAQPEKRTEERTETHSCDCNQQTGCD